MGFAAQAMAGASAAPAAAANPAALLPAFLVASLASDISGATSQSMGARTAGQIGRKAARQNAAFAAMQADDALRRGREEVGRHQRSTRALAGSQRARMAAQGVDIGSGSALDLQMETAELGALDAATIRNNAMREAFGYRMQQADYRGQARFAGVEGRARAGQSLLTGGLSAIRSFGEYAYERERLRRG